NPATPAGTPGDQSTTQASLTANPPTATQPLTPTPPAPTLTATPVAPTETPIATVVPITSKALLCVKAFNDANTNHWQDPDENLLPGVNLALSQGSGGSAAQNLTTTAETAACFDNIPVGQFSVAATPPGGYGPTTSSQLEVDVKAGAQTIISFGFAKG